VKVEVLPDPAAVAARAAEFVEHAARRGVAARGRFLFAVSGGTTPWRMLEHLAVADVPWEAIHLLQVDERVAPAGDPVRNLTRIEESLLRRVPLPADRVHAMPVEATDVAAAADEYARTLARVAGTPPVLDLVHLGLGADGHTASLLPGDAALGLADREVAVTGCYQGTRRMTLTRPVLDRARSVLWLVCGLDKAPALARLRAGDRGIPAGLVNRDRALLLADAAAAGGD